MVRRRRRESGQATMEFAFTIVVFFFALIMIIDIAWWVYSEATLSYAFTQAQWNVTREQVADVETHGQEAADELFKEMIVSHIKVDPSTVQVSDASFDFEVLPHNDLELDYNPEDHLRGLWRATTDQVNLRIEGDVKCRIDMLIPLIIDHVDFSYHLNKVGVISRQFEVS